MFGDMIKFIEKCMVFMSPLCLLIPLLYFKKLNVLGFPNWLITSAFLFYLFIYIKYKGNLGLYVKKNTKSMTQD